MYKALILSSYTEYKNQYYTIKSKYPTHHPYMTIEENEKMGPEYNKDAIEASKKQTQVVNEIVDLIGVYCKQYPGEQICQYPQWKTYKEYPWRVRQGLPEFMKHL